MTFFSTCATPLKHIQNDFRGIAIAEGDLLVLSVRKFSMPFFIFRPNLIVRVGYGAPLEQVLRARESQS